MSLNIQTADGLLEIGGKVTKDKVVEALGYEPANETHVEDNTVHITPEERENWNNKFDGTYVDLEGSPNITEDESGSLVIADNNGNAIMQVDENGITTTNVNTKTIALNGEDIGAKIDTHIDDSVSHVTSSERTKWNNKSDFSGDYNDLNNKPNITDNESGELVLNDSNGNVIAKINENGFETTTVTAKSAIIGGVDITTKLDEHKDAIDGVGEDLETHTSDEDIHITADERTFWNNKSEFSGDYNDLANAPDIVEDESGEVVYTDEVGNVIAKIGQSGFETTQVTAKSVIANGVDVGTTISSHVGNDDIHITDEERKSWNDKADKSYVDESFANLVNSAPEKLNTLDELAAALGDDENFAVTVTNSLAEKAKQTDLDAHTDNKSNPHNVTASQVGLGNVDNTSDINKPVSTAQREALNALKDELSESIVSESDEWIVVDENGNIIAMVDDNGLETTTVTAKNVVVNGTDVTEKFDKLDESISSHASNATSHITQEERVSWNEKATTSYVDGKVNDHSSNTVVHITSDERTAWNAKTDQTDFKAHTDDQSNPHKVTKAQVGLGNVDNTSDKNKPVSTAQQAALDSLKSELSETIVSESKEWIIADEDGNVISKVDSNGLETTKVTAKTVVVNGTDVESALAGKASGEHKHSISDVTNLETNLNTKADKSYVDAELAKKANTSALSDYYTKAEIDAVELIAIADIDAICGATL